MSLPIKRRSISLSLAKIRLNRLEICKICLKCGEEFLAKNGPARFCSRLCYRRYLRKNPTPLKKEKGRKLQYWGTSAGRASYRRNAHRIEIRKALMRLAGPMILFRIDVSFLYKKLVEAVNRDKKKAVRVLEGGTPDAVDTYTEYKFGIDGLRASQMILDILGGHKGKVRWIPNYDSLEITLRGGKNESILFESYLSYLQACEKTRTLNFK